VDGVLGSGSSSSRKHCFSQLLALVQTPPLLASTLLLAL
jgi:hypothetical protein